MESEMLKIFDENEKQIGIATREEVHRKGHWHETFQCWFISKEEKMDYIYFQLRSELKKDYPDLYDITAAGHILADETVEDGIREIKEELGIDISFNELIPLGIVNYCVVKDYFIDKELANLFLYKRNISFDEFILQKQEVSGIVRADFDEFAKLWSGEKDEITIKGFEINENDEKVIVDKMIGKNKFVPHEDAFYETIIKLIKNKI